MRKPGFPVFVGALKRQDAETASVVCVKRGSNVRPLAGICARLLLVTVVACGVVWTAGGTATAQEASPEASPTVEPGATPTAPETKADEAPQESAPAETQAEPPSSAGETGEPSAEPKESSPIGKRWIRGSFEAGFDGVWSDDDSNVDLDQTIRLQLDPPAYPNIHIRGALRLQEDLTSDKYYESAIRDYDDTVDSDVRVNLLNLYVDVDDLWGDSVLRIGRQRIAESPLYNRMDGIYFKQRVDAWQWYVFGGARASNYYDSHGDLVLGGGVSVQATPTTRLALDAFYGEEERDDDDVVRPWPVYEWFGLDYPRRIEDDIDDNYVSLSVWQWFPPNATLFGRFSLQNGEPNDLTLSLTGQYEPWDVAYEATYYGQLQENEDLVNDLTAYYRILGAYEKYDDVLLAVHKPITKILTLSLEAEFHESHASGDETWSNRDFQRYAIILDADELVPTVDASIALERWDVDEGEGTWAVTGEVSKTWERVKLTLGADYERYEDRVVKYNPWALVFDNVRQAVAPNGWPIYNPIVFVFDDYAVETHENIYSVFGKVSYDLTEAQELALKITYEEDDGPDSPYWRVQAGYTINF
jgi:hypothetical protein